MSDDTSTSNSPEELLSLARATVDAENAYNRSFDKQERRELARVSMQADTALETAMGNGITLAVNVLRLAGKAT